MTVGWAHGKRVACEEFKRVAVRCFYQLRQLQSIRQALSADSARMLVHALITNHVDYCNSILCHAAATHLRQFQSVLNAAARLVVKKRKCDSITPTLRDDLHWLLVHQRIDYKLCLRLQMPAPVSTTVCRQ